MCIKSKEKYGTNSNWWNTLGIISKNVRSFFKKIASVSKNEFEFSLTHYTAKINIGEKEEKTSH